jgi:hypothetical protein
MEKYEFRGPMLTRVNKVSEPNVTEEVKQWGDLVQWIRVSEMEPEEVRALITFAKENLKYEGGLWCLSAESTLKRPD